MPTTTNAMPDRWLFVRKFLTQGTRVASFSPSSRSLSEAMCRHVDTSRPQTIVELGAGSGAVTAVAAECMHPDSRLIAVELDADFAARLAQRGLGVEVICGDVRELPGALAQRGVEPVDVVISGLPTPSLPGAVNRAVFEWLAEQPAGTVFSQLTVMPWVYKPLYTRLFRDVAFNLVTRNLPPGGVYHCTGLRGDYADHLPGK